MYDSHIVELSSFFPLCFYTRPFFALSLTLSLLSQSYMLQLVHNQHNRSLLRRVHLDQTKWCYCWNDTVTRTLTCNFRVRWTKVERVHSHTMIERMIVIISMLFCTIFQSFVIVFFFSGWLWHFQSYLSLCIWAGCLLESGLCLCIVLLLIE